MLPYLVLFMFNTMCIIMITAETADDSGEAAGRLSLISGGGAVNPV